MRQEKTIMFDGKLYSYNDKQAFSINPAAYQPRFYADQYSDIGKVISYGFFKPDGLPQGISLHDSGSGTLRVRYSTISRAVSVADNSRTITTHTPQELRRAYLTMVDLLCQDRLYPSYIRNEMIKNADQVIGMVDVNNELVRSTNPYFYHNGYPKNMMVVLNRSGTGDPRDLLLRYRVKTPGRMNCGEAIVQRSSHLNGHLNDDYKIMVAKAFDRNYIDATLASNLELAVGEVYNVAENKVRDYIEVIKQMKNPTPKSKSGHTGLEFQYVTRT